MPLILTISEDKFVDLFLPSGDSFSLKGLRELYHYLNDLSDSCNMNIEASVGDIRHDFHETTLDDFMKERLTGDEVEKLQKNYDLDCAEEVANVLTSHEETHDYFLRAFKDNGVIKVLSRRC